MDATRLVMTICKRKIHDQLVWRQQISDFTRTSHLVEIKNLVLRLLHEVYSTFEHTSRVSVVVRYRLYGNGDVANTMMLS